jgi:putative transposase
MDEKEARYQQLIGQLSYEIEWLKKNLASNNAMEARKTMAESDNKKTNLARQAKLLSINRTSLYRKPSLHGMIWTCWTCI